MVSKQKNKMKENKVKTKIYRAALIGIFFLLAFLLYGIGQSLFETETQLQKYIGILLIILNSIIVFLIGFFIRKMLKYDNPFVGNIYFITRFLEAILLGSVVFNLIPKIDLDKNYTYFLPMLILGIGSIPMCFTLHKNKLIPNWLAIWGMFGYAVFAFGFLMELFGIEWSMYFLGIGGLWEIVFAIWLIVKGWKNE